MPQFNFNGNINGDQVSDVLEQIEGAQASFTGVEDRIEALEELGYTVSVSYKNGEMIADIKRA